MSVRYVTPIKWQHSDMSSPVYATTCASISDSAGLGSQNYRYCRDCRRLYMYIVHVHCTCARRPDNWEAITEFRAREVLTSRGRLDILQWHLRVFFVTLAVRSRKVRLYVLCQLRKTAWPPLVVHNDVRIHVEYDVLFTWVLLVYYLYSFDWQLAGICWIEQQLQWLDGCTLVTRHRVIAMLSKHLAGYLSVEAKTICNAWCTECIILQTFFQQFFTRATDDLIAVPDAAVLMIQITNVVTCTCTAVLN